MRHRRALWWWGRAPVAVLASAVLVVAVTAPVHAAPAPVTPQRVSLQASDLPGFSAVDPSIETFQDPNDQGGDQAFIQCAGSTPLLDEFDIGSHATVSQAYGQGTNAFGSPVLSAASAVFTDGSATDAATAFAVLRSDSFQQCWARTQDALNRAQGITVPISPSTVSPLSVPAYGAGATAFTITLHYSALGTAITGEYGTSVIEYGTYVVMLITLGYDTTFPDALRLGALARIAARLGAPQRSTVTTTGESPCTAPSPVTPTTLLTDTEVGAALGAPMTYAGWTETPAAATGTVAERSCIWDGPRAPAGGPLPYQLAATLAVSDPYPIGGAKAQYDSELKGWQATSFSGVGDAAFWLPIQDWSEGLVVLTGDRVLTVGITARATDPQQYRPAELQLAALAVSRLGTGSGTAGPAPPGSSIEDAMCHLGLSLGVEPKWLHDINDAMQKAALRLRNTGIPIPIASIDMPSGFALNVAPSLDPGNFTFCGVGLTAAVDPPPWSQNDATQVKITGLGGGTWTQLGPLVYSAPDGAWSTVDQATPPGQPLVTKWGAVPTVVPWNPSFGLTWTSEGLQAQLALAQIRVASVHSEVKLVVRGESVLSVDLGPSLLLTAYISNKNLVDELAKELKQEVGDSDPATAGTEAEQTAAQDLSAQAGDDLSAAMKVYDQQMLDISAKLTSELQGSVDQQLLAKFTTWFADLQAGSPEVQELVDEGVTADEVPVAAEAALEAELGGDGLITVVEVGCDVFLDGACLAVP